MRSTHVVGLSLCASLLSVTAQAQGLSDGTRNFLRSEAQGSAYELAIAQLAADKGMRANIKSYARTVIADHEQLNGELRQLAQSKGVALPAAMTAKQQHKLSTLRGLDGAAFDRAYKTETIRINSQDRIEDKEQLGQTSDQEVKSFVQKLQQADTKHYELGEHLTSS